MSLKFHPKTGTILICDYTTGFVLPEMVKPRPVIVVSPRLRSRTNLCTVVPLSTKEPNPVEAYHHKIDFDRPLPKPYDYQESWAKCDMLATVGFKRLKLIKIGKDQEGKRKYLKITLPEDDMEAILNCVKYALGLHN